MSWEDRSAESKDWRFVVREDGTAMLLWRVDMMLFLIVVEVLERKDGGGGLVFVGLMLMLCFGDACGEKRGEVVVMLKLERKCKKE